MRYPPPHNRARSAIFLCICFFMSNCTPFTAVTCLHFRFDLVFDIEKDLVAPAGYLVNIKRRRCACIYLSNVYSPFHFSPQLCTHTHTHTHTHVSLPVTMMHSRVLRSGKELVADKPKSEVKKTRKKRRGRKCTKAGQVHKLFRVCCLS